MGINWSSVVQFDIIKSFNLELSLNQRNIVITYIWMIKVAIWVQQVGRIGSCFNK